MGIIANVSLESDVKEVIKLGNTETAIIIVFDCFEQNL